MLYYLLRTIGLMKRLSFDYFFRCMLALAVSPIFIACSSMQPASTGTDINAVEVQVVTGFHLDVTVEEETIAEKKIRAVAETEITIFQRDSLASSSQQCVALARSIERDSETSPGRMALAGGGATLTQGGNVGRVKANPRTYFLGPMNNSSEITERQLNDFLATSTDHPALSGAELVTFRLDIVATPAGDPRKPISCMPNLGASQRYQGDGERRSFTWHGVDFNGVPERFLNRVLRDTRDVTIAVLDAATRVPIENATVEVRNLNENLMSYEQFARRYLSGVQDAFILELYAGFSDSDYFKFTNAQVEYRNGDKLRLSNEQSVTLPVTISAPGYLPVMGQALVSETQRNIYIFMTREDAVDTDSFPAGIQTN